MPYEDDRLHRYYTNILILDKSMWWVTRGTRIRITAAKTKRPASAGL
jgi:hypothetical protein